MKSEKEIRAEILELLTLIYFEWSKEITDDLVSFWRENLRGLDVGISKLAAKELIAKKTFGEPKFQDFAACYCEIAAAYPQKRKVYNPWVSKEPKTGLQRLDSILVIPPNRKLLEQ